MIIGITGLIGSGKDTVADYLCTVHGFKRMSFAATLKDAVSVVFGWDRELLEGSTKTSREWRERVDVWWATRLKIPGLTPRWVLQQWGTEVLRRGFHDDIWVASLENNLRKQTDNVVITDCRFPNEIMTIRAAGGIAIRTHRGLEPNWIKDAIIVNKGHMEPGYEASCEVLKAFNIHASEFSSVGLKYDYHLDNNGTIDDLHKQIELVLSNQPASLLVSK
jgi:hypothetical protein